MSKRSNEHGEVKDRLVYLVAYIWTPTAIMGIQAAAAICVRPTSLKVTILACKGSEVTTEVFSVRRGEINEIHGLRNQVGTGYLFAVFSVRW